MSIGGPSSSAKTAPSNLVSECQYLFDTHLQNITKPVKNKSKLDLSKLKQLNKELLEKLDSDPFFNILSVLEKSASAKMASQKVENGMAASATVVAITETGLAINSAVQEGFALTTSAAELTSSATAIAGTVLGSVAAAANVGLMLRSGYNASRFRKGINVYQQNIDKLNNGGYKEGELSFKPNNKWGFDFLPLLPSSKKRKKSFGIKLINCDPI